MPPQADSLDNASLPGIKINVVMGRNAGFLTAAAALARGEHRLRLGGRRVRAAGRGEVGGTYEGDAGLTRSLRFKNPAELAAWLGGVITLQGGSRV